MADRIFKGRLVLTGEICHENLAFTEASEDFDTAHAGGLVPFEVLQKILLNSPKIIEIIGEHGSIWISGQDDTWIKIDPDGTIEIGAGAA